ncbi:MAG TPA: protein translocase subunit SecD [Candidatus Peribacterales bacterium]|nr:protein translocase subunit SecD [Candidatus Peribacterales bacterium]
MVDSKLRTYGYPAAIILVALWISVIALPSGWKGSAPAFLKPSLHLGLDLQGGTQLDFRISEAEMEKQIEQLKTEIAAIEAADGSSTEIADKRAQISNIEYQQQNIVEAIRTVLERRVNALGVSEAVITPSYYGNEKHFLVECPGVVDVQQCINTVGKTILLEFKEQFEGEDESHIAAMRALAEKVNKRITQSGETLATAGQDVSSTLGVFYTDEASFFRSELPESIADVWNRTVDSPILMREVNLGPVPVGDGTVENRGMMFVEVTGGKIEAERALSDPIAAMGYLAEMEEAITLKKHTNEDPASIDASVRATLGDNTDVGTLLKAENTKKEPVVLLVTRYVEPVETIEASHILIAYQGAVRAEPTVTRAKERAEQLAREVMKRVQNGENFEKLARELSDGTSAKESGRLGEFGRGEQASAFENAVWDLGVGDVTGPVETEFGYHIIRKDRGIKTKPGSIDYEELVFTGENAATLQADTFTKLQNRAVTKKDEQMKLRTLFFSFLPTGWKDTALDGKHFRRASVTTDPTIGVPVVQIVFDEEGGKLFQELTKKNIGKPIAIFVGGELVSAPNVQQEIAGGTAVITGSNNFDEANRLAQDLNTGAIPAPIHLMGQTTIEASLGGAALQKSIIAALIGFALVGLYMIASYRILGVVAMLSLFVYAVIYLAIVKLPLFLFTQQYIVLTLAGVAGVILSIGMAVDANILIFERLKEELRKGKLFTTAVDIAFRRTWAPIRDSNLSIIITSAVLFLIGTSIVRGFAVTLAMGVPISMFTAIIVTRFFVSLLAHSPISQNLAAFGVELKSEEQKVDDAAPVRIIFVKFAKLFLPVSTILCVFALILLVYPGPKLGIEFMGGTLMEIQIDAENTKDDLTASLAAFPSEDPLDNVSIFAAENAAGPSYLMRFRLLTNEEHLALLKHLGTELGTVKELKFTTIGPSVSATLKEKSFIALACASAAIICYLALAFRKIPRRLSSFRFGVVAIVAPLHTILLMVLLFTGLSYWTTFQVDTLFVTALLSVMGYSVNDVIVILDRVRDNVLDTRGKGEFAELVERSLRQTLRRTLNTGFGALIMLFVLLFFGSESIFWFILAMIVGTFVGTYSSYFVATPLLVLWQKYGKQR